MRRSLILHPHSYCPILAQIEVETARLHSGKLILSYTATGNINDISIPAVQSPTRGDELWRHTCFEAFVRMSDGAEYYELNFSPSTRWAAYRFANYRSGMREAAEIRAIQIDTQSSSNSYTLQASLEMADLSGLSRNISWHLGLSAVIEETSGRKSYWALAHPPGKPDFHHAACFVHEFSPREQT